MGLFSKSFKRQIEDPDLGIMNTAFRAGGVVGWETIIPFLGTEIPILINGTREGLDPEEKAWLLAALKQEKIIEKEANKGLKDLYEKSGQKFKSWKEHFDCACMLTNEMGYEVSLCFVEKVSETSFNVYFMDNKLVDISMDS